MGTLLLEDIGGTPDGWGVRVTGSNGSATWLYLNLGDGQLSIQPDGSCTLSGGSVVVRSSLMAEMRDCAPLIQRMYTMVCAAPSLHQAWQTDAMGLMHRMGLPRGCMYNLDRNCCAQFVSLLADLPLSPPQASRADIEMGLGSWLKCASCKAFFGGAVILSMFAVIGILGAFALAADVSDEPGAKGNLGPGAVGYLEHSQPIKELAAATGIPARPLAEASAASYGNGNSDFFLLDMLKWICTHLGACEEGH